MMVDLPDDPEREREDAYRFDSCGPDRFRAPALPSGLLRHYGGLMVSQALAAARLTVPDDKDAHSLHLFYQRPGMVDRPIELAVTRETDGRSFAQRRVALTQEGAPVAHAMVSFQTPEDGPCQQVPMPHVPPPEDLESLAALIQHRLDEVPLRHRPFWCRRQQVDWRPVEPFLITQAPVRPARRHFWFRFNGPVAGPHHVQQRLLAYATDTHILQTGLLPLGIAWTDSHIQTSSLDHTIWFHGAFHVDDWLLYALDSPAASGNRVLSSGSVFRRDGTLVASVMQQGLARLLPEAREGRI